MSRASEEVLLIVAHVKNKKCEGNMYMMGQRMAWMPQAKSTFTISYNYADIKSKYALSTIHILDGKWTCE